MNMKALRRKHEIFYVSWSFAIRTDLLKREREREKGGGERERERDRERVGERERERDGGSRVQK